MTDAANFLLKHFDRLAEAPGGIAKLRALILHLATSGTFTGGKTSSWSSAPLGEIGEWGSGGTPSKAHPEYYGGDIPWLVIGDLNDGLVTKAETFITKEGLENSSAKLVEPGTLLIAMYGSIGKLGIAGIRCATNQAIAFCRPDTRRVSLEFLFLTLRDIRLDLLSRGQGVAQQNISQRILKSVTIDVPSLLEQGRIVAKVEELMGLCDALEAAQREREAVRTHLRTSALHQLTSPDSDTKSTAFVLQNLTRFTVEKEDLADIRHSVLQLAIGGRIVPQSAKESRPVLPLPDEFQEIDAEWPTAEIPTTWVTCPLGQLLSSITNGITVTPSKIPQRFAVTRIETIWNGYVDMSRVGFVDELTDTQVERFTLKHGDILLSHINSEIHLGKTAIVQNPPSNLIHGMNLLRLCFFPEFVDPTFAHYQLTALRYAGYFVLRAQRAVNQSSLNQAKIKKTPFNLPPLAEQRRIVAKVDELMGVLDALEVALTTVRTTAEKLLAATTARLHAA